jgi:hypothetical protein
MSLRSAAEGSPPGGSLGRSSQRPPGCASVLVMELFSAPFVLAFGRTFLAPRVESLFFNFKGFIVGYGVVCVVLLVAIMGSQAERKSSSERD